jgi:hypothetical protein
MRLVFPSTKFVIPLEKQIVWVVYETTVAPNFSLPPLSKNENP